MEDLPAEPEAPAAAEEAPLDDLFGEAPADETATTDEEIPAELPTTAGEESDAPMDDLFGAESMEDLPAEPEAPAPADDAGGFDDLFGAPEESAPADEAPADEAPAKEDTEESDGFDDLFGAAQPVLEQPGGFSSVEMRTWIDNTGLYRTRGRLVTVTDGAVKLMKSNGRVSTVALGRLSPADVSFVNRQAAAQRSLTILQTAQR
jgi:hypothetical protein